VRKETRVVLLLAALVLAGCAYPLPDCPTADYSAECHDLNTRDCDEPRREQPQPNEPDYDRRNAI